MTEKKLTREQARELYDDLHKAMTQMMAKRGQPIPPAIAQAASQTSSNGANAKVAKEIAEAIKSGLNGKPAPTPASSTTTTARTAPRARQSTGRSPSVFARSTASGAQGAGLAVMVIALFCCAKLTLSALEASGLAKVEVAQATVVAAPVPTGPQWSKEELKVLTALDHRRAELEERGARMDQRELELVARDRDIAARLTELKELTERLKIERQKDDKQRSVQLDQLSNVYGSMNPPEAAQLLEQLDIQVCLSLIERMPEKRIGQILALMAPQRALELTNLLSKRRP